MPPVSGAEMLRHPISARNLTQARLAAETGLSALPSGKRELSRRHIEIFAQFFHVGPAVFLPD